MRFIPRQDEQLDYCMICGKVIPGVNPGLPPTDVTADFVCAECEDKVEARFTSSEVSP